MEFTKRLIKHLYGFVVSLSPNIEIFFRQLYWKNISNLKEIVDKKALKNDLTDFTKVIEFLKSLLCENDILIVHSSFTALNGVGKSPKQIINELINLVGKNGTLAMNSARIFSEEGKIEDILDEKEINIAEYNLKKSKVWTGAIPLFMVRDSRSVISKFPLNPMVAIGNQALNMMEKNIEGDNCSSCGPYSSWKYCTDRNALVVGIGLDLTHSLTIMHVAEENKNEWPIKNWFRKRKFKIIDGDQQNIIEVNERRPKWGLLHFAERTLRKDLIKSGVLNSHEIDGFRIEYLRAKTLFDFLNSKNEKGYPYFKCKNL